MATANFSVPDGVKEIFDATFGDQNKSAIIGPQRLAAGILALSTEVACLGSNGA